MFIRLTSCRKYLLTFVVDIAFFPLVLDLSMFVLNLVVIGFSVASPAALLQRNLT